MTTQQVLAGAGIAVISAGATAALTPSQPLDCKGQECKVQVLVDEPHFKDAIYYTADQWNSTTAEEIDAEAQARYDKWVQLVQEQSKATSSNEQITP